MTNLRQNAALWMAVSLATALTACGGGGGSTPPPPPPVTYTLTVNSTNPATGVGMTVSPADNNGAANGSASFTRTYNSGTAVTVTAPATAGSNAFASWSGCTSASTETCSVTMNANTTVTAAFAPPKTTPTAVAVDQSSVGPAVTDRLLGMNMAAWYDPTTSAIVPAFQAAGIQAVRWPGGSWSDDYHWATNTMCGNTPNGNATFTNFVNDLATPGSFDVALTANYGTNAACTGPGDPTEAAAWITKAKSINAHVSHMTVGNEEYGNWEDDLHTLKNNAGTYATAVGTASTSAGYYAQIKAADSSVLVGVDVNPGNNPAWDPTVLANAQYDFVEYHYYPQAPGSESDTYLVQQAAQDLTTSINTIKSELATAGKPNTPIYVGEIGSVYTNPGKQSLSITQGLYAGQVLGEMMNDGVSRATWWIGFGNCNGTNGNDSSSLYGWQNFGGYNVFADGPTDTGCAGAGPIGTMSPTARAFQLFSKVAVNGESVLSANVTGDTINVRAYAATNNGGTALVLFNLSQTVSEPVTVSLSAQATSTNVSVETYSKALYDQSQNNVWAAPTSSDLGAQNLPLALTLDPWSMNVVIIK